MTVPDWTGDRLIDAGLDFSFIVSQVLNGSVTDGVLFDVAPYITKDRVWIFPHGSTPAKLVLVPLTVGLADPADCRLFLKISYQALLDDKREHLAIQTSNVHLLVATGDKEPRPVIRLEYDRDQGSEPDDPKPGSHRRSAAHVQIHGTSAELAAVQTIRRIPITGLERLHIPVGGRRFRPSLEDFIEFLATHDLVAVKDDWRTVISAHRTEWLRRQHQAAVRADPDVAIEQLERMGYTVSRP